jgi:LysM repeat protein/lysophospholipase L1-like esterase
LHSRNSAFFKLVIEQFFKLLTFTYMDKKFSIRLFCVVLLLGFMPAGATVKGDSSSGRYYWLNPDLNFIQFYERSAFEPFYNKWTKGEPITIVHFGDSHVQPDIYTGELRKILQQEKGLGGRGMIFPYSIASTYSTLDYASYHTGSWRASRSIEYVPKLPLGISGVTAKTSDPSASFTIRFHNPFPSHYRKLKIFCKQQRSSYDVVVSSGGESTPVAVDETGESFQSFIEVLLPVVGNTITVQVVKQNEYENDFEFHGMSLESATTDGLLLHCLGVGGSQFRSLLAEKLFDVQMTNVSPDLAILDFGTNDHLYNNSVPADMEAKIVQVINRVRKAAPNCTVLLTTTQDMNRRGVNITSGRDYSALIRKIAKDQGCAFYDWYWVSGGPQRMTLWQQNGLAQVDNIHLTITGYTLKGKLLGDAFKSSLAKLGGEMDSLVFNPDTLTFTHMIARQDSTMKRVQPSPAIRVAESNGPVNTLYHKIAPGETLSQIAEKYHVSVSSIRYANGIQGSRIIAGKTLRIEQPKGYVATASTKKEKVKQTTEDKKIDQAFTQILNTKLIQHKIASGETLSEIADKYDVSIKQLKKTNGLKTSKIIAGKTLMIEVPLSADKKSKT